MIELSAQEIFDEARQYLLSGGYFQSTSYDTSLLISERDSYDAYHYFELFGRKILWINQVEQDINGDKKLRMARTIFACDEQDFDGHIVAHRFSSLLCFATHGEFIFPRMWVGTAFPVPSSVQPAEKFIGTLFSHEDIDNAISRLNVEDFISKKWIALAHYRQAVLATTPYYKVLSYWKIIELYYSKVNSNMNGFINNWYINRPDWFSALEPFNGTAATKLRSVRNLSAHFELTGGDIADPDNPDLYNKADNATFVLKRLSEDLINNATWT